MCETKEIDESYMLKKFNFIARQMGCSTVETTLIEEKLISRYYKENWNRAGLMYKQTKLPMQGTVTL